MKLLSIISIGLGMMAGGAHAQSYPVEITCGDFQQGPAVKFEISPIEKKVKYTYSLNGESHSVTFAPTRGIYDSSSLEFGGDEFHNSVYVHAAYAQIVRVNHHQAVSIGLEKLNGNSGSYQLTKFSDGYSTDSSTNEIPVEEKDHQEFIGLSCSIEGISSVTGSQCKVPPQNDCSNSPKRLCCDCDASGKLACS